MAALELRGLERKITPLPGSSGYNMRMRLPIHLCRHIEDLGMSGGSAEDTLAAQNQQKEVRGVGL